MYGLRCCHQYYIPGLSAMKRSTGSPSSILYTKYRIPNELLDGVPVKRTVKKYQIV